MDTLLSEMRRRRLMVRRLRLQPFKESIAMNFSSGK